MSNSIRVSGNSIEYNLWKIEEDDANKNLLFKGRSVENDSYETKVIFTQDGILDVEHINVGASYESTDLNEYAEIESGHGLSGMGMCIVLPSGIYHVTFSSQYKITNGGAIALAIPADVLSLLDQLNDNVFVDDKVTFTSNQIVSPGYYVKSDAAFALTSITLDGDSESVWVFKIAAALSMAADVTVTLSGGASAKNVFWIVGAAFSAAAGANMKGTIITGDAASLAAGVTVDGRIYSINGAISLQDNSAVYITGIPSTFDLGSARDYSIFASGTTVALGTITAVGSINFTGSVGSMNGTIDGYGEYDKIGQSPDIAGLVNASFGIYLGGVIIPSSLIVTESGIGTYSVNLECVILIEHPNILNPMVTVNSNVGGIVLKNRSMIAVKMKSHSHSYCGIPVVDLSSFVATESAFYTDPNMYEYNGNNMIDSDNLTYWSSPYQYDNISGLIHADFNADVTLDNVVYSGHWVNFDFGELRNIMSYTIVPNNESGGIGVPNRWSLFTSTNGTDWFKIDESVYNNETNESFYAFTKEQPIYLDKFYTTQYIRLLITQVFSNEIATHDYTPCSISEIKFLEYV
jgi:hypothetical protein